MVWLNILVPSASASCSRAMSRRAVISVSPSVSQVRRRTCSVSDGRGGKEGDVLTSRKHKVRVLVQTTIYRSGLLESWWHEKHGCAI